MFEDMMTKINAIEIKLSILLDLHVEQTNSLTSYNQVATFLGKTTRTIHNYIKESKLVANKHYYITENGKTVFVPKAIIEFKENPFHGQHIEKGSTVSKVMHPIASSILKGVA